MAGAGMRAKVGVTMPDGHVFANSIMLRAAKRAHDKIAGAGVPLGKGSAEAMAAAREAARLAAPPEVRNAAHKPSAPAQKADLRQFGPKPYDERVGERFATKGHVADLKHYEHVLDRMREEGVTPALQAELKAIRARRSQEQNRSGLQGDLFAGFSEAPKAAPKPASGRMGDAEYRAAVERAGVKTAQQYADERLQAIREARKAVAQAREMRQLAAYQRKAFERADKFGKQAMLDRPNYDARVAEALRAVRDWRSIAHNATKDAARASLSLPNAIANERHARGESKALSTTARPQKPTNRRPPAELPQTKSAKVGGPSNFKTPHGNIVASIAHAGNLHVHQDIPSNKMFRITHAPTGKTVLNGMTKSEAIAALRGMRSGRTVERAAAGSKLAQKAAERYTSILRRREAVAMAAREHPKNGLTAKQKANRIAAAEAAVADARRGLWTNSHTPREARERYLSEAEKMLAEARAAR